MNLECKMVYCPRCGDISWMGSKKCIACNHDMFEINPKWGITVEKYRAIGDQVKYGEKTEEECDKELEDYCKTFREEVVKNHRDFDQYLYDHRDEILKQKIEDYFNGNRESSLPQPVRDAIANAAKNQSSTPTIKCPYCQSTDTKKISAASRGLSFSIFGFGSKKIGKQWHCNGCGSDF